MAIDITAPPSETIEQQFHRLESQWNAETQFLSDPGKIMGHPAMRAIVALGQPVVPIILHELQAGRPGSSLLAWALPEITGVDLAPPLIDGAFVTWDVRAQVAAWLKWGRERGIA